MQEIEIWPYNQMVYAQTRICPREWDAQNSQGFWDTNESPNLNQKTKPSDREQKTENLLNCGLCHPGRQQSEKSKKMKREISTLTFPEN